MPLTRKSEDLWAEFAHQAEFPPGGDEVIGACYKAVEQLRKRNDGFAKKLEQIAETRGMPKKHLVNLFFRAVQYMRFFEQEEVDYPEKFFDSDEWEKELRSIMDGKVGERFFELLSQRDTGTTVYQRYAGPKAILSALWPNRKLTITDLGCGGNHGLPGLSAGEKFKPVVDHTPDTVVTKWIEKPINLKLGLGVDKYDPYDPEMINWRIACSFYPSELAEMNEFLEFEKRIRKRGRDMFVLGDIITLMSDGLTVRKYDAVVLSTVLYQMNEKERKNTLDKAMEMLKTDGVEIAQDFARKGEDGKNLVFEGSWFGDGFGYRTFIRADWTRGKYWEILRWRNGRCKEVRVGEDFDKFFAIVKHRRKRLEVKAGGKFDKSKASN